MQVEHQLHVVDARDVFLSWNDSQFKKIPDRFGGELYSICQLIPFLLHTNSRFLPGFVRADVPYGVYAYKPEQTVLNEAKLLNSKFQYQDEGIIKNSAIDSIIFHSNLIEKSLKCWVFKSPELNKSQSQLLSEKISKISAWILGRGVKLEFVLLTVSEFREYPEYSDNENKAIFLDYFYSESIYLAGKYPVWWLVPPDKNDEYAAFVEHIKQARFVEEGDYLDLGSANDLNKSDILKHAIDRVQTVKKSAETCMVKLLIANEKIFSWPYIDGISIRLKNELYQSNTDVQPINIIADIMNDTYARYYDKQKKHKPGRIFSKLKNTPGSLNPEVFDAFLGDEFYQEVVGSGIDSIISYLNLFKSVAYDIKRLFSDIVKACDKANNEDSFDPALYAVAVNMLSFLSENSDRVPLYNTKDKNEIVLDRIQLKHEIDSNDEEQWSLVLQEVEGTEKSIEGFSSLLGLLAWCWLNRVVNHSTQVSINCPLQQVKQTEAFYVLEMLMQHINPQLISNIPSEAFENPVRPLQSMLFVNFMAAKAKSPFQFTVNDDPLSFGQNSTNLVTHCEQLIVNSWGDVYTKKYTGNMGILECLCEWTHHAPIDSLSMPQKLETFGHGTGDSTYMAQRVDQVYDEMIEFFYRRKLANSRFVIRLASDFYVVSVDDNLLTPKKIGNQKRLFDYLESAQDHFVSSAVESRAFAEEPLREIYQYNKQNVLQVFFRINNRNAHCWVLDENGTLWRDVIENFDKDSFVTHWLYLYRNIRKRLKSTSYQDKELPILEIKQVSFNQLGGLEFYTIGADSISGAKDFIDVQLHIESHEDSDQINLVCDGKQFSYKELKNNALIECVHYISSTMITTGRMPIYITDVDVPLRLFNIAQRDEVQTTHLLKFKRTFKRRILKLLES